MELNYYTLDVFTQTRFGGNPLAVVLDADGLSDEVMQSIAREFNLSETVFVRKAKRDGVMADLRIFTPGKELPFAGHPIIGTAVLLADIEWNDDEILRLEVPIGVVDVKIGDDEGRDYAQFLAPGLPDTVQPVKNVKLLATALGLTQKQIGFDDHQPHIGNVGVGYLYVPVKDQASVAAATLEHKAWQKLNEGALIGAFIYCAGGVEEGSAYHGRMLSDPSLGIGEDPATGSCAAVFPGQLLASNALSEGANRLVVEQGYEMGRPSKLLIEADVADNRLTAVRVSGHAVMVARGRLFI